MKLTDAIRITTSVPLYFQPVKYNNKTFIDGGCMDNYPINLFTDRLQEVIGVYLYPEITNTNINNLKEGLSSGAYLVISFTYFSRLSKEVLSFLANVKIIPKKLSYIGYFISLYF